MTLCLLNKKVLGNKICFIPDNNLAHWELPYTVLRVLLETQHLWTQLGQYIKIHWRQYTTAI